MKTKPRILPLILIIAVLLAAGILTGALAESYTAGTMRLLRYEGDVEIEDPSGNARFVMENVRFASGESMRTGAGSTASVSLDEGRIVSLDEETRVEFAQSGNSMLLTLTDGTLMLDVAEKLGDDETLEIATSTSVVGIRGTVVFVSVRPDGAADGAGLHELLSTPASGGAMTTLGVLEGTAQFDYRDESGAQKRIMVAAGQKATVVDSDENGLADAAPEQSALTAADITAFMLNEIGRSDELWRRIQKENDSRELISDAYSADGDWLWTGTVTFVAQSASKLYDSQPLTRTGDVLIYGLPAGFSASVRAGGGQTGAGESENPVSTYKIYNAAGEDVTAHFPGIETVSGTLIVDPAPVTVWTDSAEKVYDGQPLTAPETAIRALPAAGGLTPERQNTSFVVSDETGSESLYGVSGSTWVHGTNPITGETREVTLNTGEKLAVYLSDENDQTSIEFRIEAMGEDEIPDEVLRLYADNPDILDRAIADTGWDREKILERIAALPDTGEDMVTRGGVILAASQTDRLMSDLTNVRINVDTDITDYNDRALTNEEAHYTGVYIDDSVVVTAAGSQTDVGQSVNGYTIDWGNADPNNFIVSEELGTLTVTAAPITVTTASDSKVYDGAPLTNSDAFITGLVNGEKATARGTGSITNVGVTENTYQIIWETAQAGNYTIVEERLGELEVTPNASAITFGTRSVSKTYDGTPLTADLEITGLPDGYTGTATVLGSQTDAGTSGTAITDIRILDPSGADVTDSFGGISVSDGTLTVNPAPLTITTGSASKVYDGQPLTSSEISADGFVNGESATLTPTGSLTDAGSAENGYSITWDGAKSENYTVTENTGTLTVEPLSIGVSMGASSADYTGAMYVPTPTVTYQNGTHAGETVAGTRLRATEIEFRYSLFTGDSMNITISGSGKDAGTYDITSSISFSGSASNYTLPDASALNLSVTVQPAPLTITTGSASKVYDGTALTSGEANVSGLAGGDTVTVTPNGSLKNVGAADNTYDIDWGETNPGNYTVSESLGTLEVTANGAEIVFTAPAGEKTYDGTPLNAGQAAVTGLPSGFTFKAPVIGSQKDAGSSTSTVDSYVIYDPDGGEATANFSNISTVSGTLTVVPKQLTVKTGSATKEYDGTPLTNAEVTAEGLIEGETLTMTAIGSVTLVGTADNTPAIEWTGANESNYAVSAVPGTLTVTVSKNPITVTAISFTEVYSGVEMGGFFSITVEGVPAGVDYFADGEVYWKNAGSYTLTPSIMLFDKETGEEVSGSFQEISIVKGTLTVTPAPARVTTGGTSKKYDGTPLMYDDAVITGLVGTDTAAVTATGKITDVGTTENTYSIDWGGTSSANYALTDELGTLEVTTNDVEINFKTGDAEKVYDGKPLSCSDVTVSGLPDGLTWTTSCDVSVTDVTEGTIYVISDYDIFDAKGTSVKSYFTNVVFGAGKLTITRRPLTITTGSAEGNVISTLTCSDCTVEGLAEGESITVTTTGVLPAAQWGPVDNTYTVEWTGAKESNYSVTSVLGTLKHTGILVLVDDHSYEITVPVDDTPPTIIVPVDDESSSP